jgi:small subunit ribosomal protein S1
LTNFGVFVELEPGLDGLVHISDLSWTKKIRHPGEVVKKGEEIEVVVLSVDTEQRKISLGHKQINDNPWDNFEKEYAAGKKTEGKVVRIIEKGLIAELPLGVDGFIPATQLSPNKIKNLSYCFPVETKLELVVLEFDKENKKIVLSALAVVKEKSDEEIAKYIEQFKLDKVSVDDIKQADTGKFDPSDFDIYEDRVEPTVPSPPSEEKKEEKAEAKVEGKEEKAEDTKEEPKAEDKKEDDSAEAEDDKKEDTK